MRSDKVMLGALATALACYVAAQPFHGHVPGAKDSGRDVVLYFLHHSSDVQWGVWFGVFALAGLMVAVALMHGRLPRPHRTVFLVGAIVTVTASMVSSWFMGGLAMHAGSLEPATARTLLDIVNFYGPVLCASTMVMIAPVALLGLRGGLPRWLGVVSAVVLAEQVVETITVFGRGGFIEPGGAMNLELGAGLFFVWLLALGWALSDRGASPTVAAADASALPAA